MKILRSIRELASINQPVHWAMGVFDGLHAGHNAVISSAVAEARKRDILAGVLTFDTHPLATIRPEVAPCRIFSGEDEKMDLLERLGIDVVLTLPFNAALADMSAQNFLDALQASCPLAGISVGIDWRFGHDRSGDVDFLKARATEHGFSVCPIPAVEIDGSRVSSTEIRHRIAAGDIAGASRLLGRPYTLAGTVIHGRELARSLGFPTANIRPDNEALPPFGVYAIRAHLPGGLQAISGIANLGQRPTVEKPGEGEILLEVHLFDWQGNLYGQHITIDCIAFLRPEARFPSVEALAAQIGKDCQKAREILSESD